MFRTFPFDVMITLYAHAFYAKLSNTPIKKLCEKRNN